jgi:hypothetical protein
LKKTQRHKKWVVFWLNILLIKLIFILLGNYLSAFCVSEIILGIFDIHKLFLNFDCKDNPHPISTHHKGGNALLPVWQKWKTSPVQAFSH